MRIVLALIAMLAASPAAAAPTCPYPWRPEPGMRLYMVKHCLGEPSNVARVSTLEGEASVYFYRYEGRRLRLYFVEQRLLRVEDLGY